MFFMGFDIFETLNLRLVASCANLFWVQNATFMLFFLLNQRKFLYLQRILTVLGQ